MEFISEAKKNPVYIENYIYQQELVLNKIRPVMKDPANREKLLDFVGGFVNDHIRELSTSGPVHMFIFGDKQTDFLYEFTNTTKEEILALFEKVIVETYGDKLSLPLVGLVKNAPHKLLVTALIVDALQSNYDDIAQCCIYIMGFADYPMVYRSSWKIGVNEEVMNYTIEHLQKKFKIKAKTLNNLLALIYYDMNKVFELCDEHLIVGADNSYVDYIYRARNQMKNTFQKIAEQYYANQKINATQYTVKDQNEEGIMLDQEGITSIMGNVVENVYTKLVTRGINKNLIKVAADSKGEISEAMLLGYVTRILDNKNNKIYEFIESLVMAFFDKNPTATSLSYGFLNFAFGLYTSINRSKNPIYENITKIMDMWMFKILDIRKDYNRDATIINYRVAIYRYFIMLINNLS